MVIIMKKNKPWIDPKNLNNTQKILATLGIIMVIALTILVLIPGKIQTPTTSTVQNNTTSAELEEYKTPAKIDDLPGIAPLVKDIGGK